MYLLIEDFKFGLDSRRFKLNAPPGTLTTLTNGHITPGGEIEKRKAFGYTAFTSGTPDTFGLEVTSDGFVTFGSKAEGSLNDTLPDDVTYVQLAHPDGASDMVSVIHSTVYNGAAFVVADYGAGGVLTWYDGVVVDDLSPGKLALVLADSEALADYIAGLINALGAGYSALASAGTVTVEGPTGQSFSVVTSNDSVCTTALPTTDLTGKTFSQMTVTAVVTGTPVPPTGVYWGMNVYYVEGVTEYYIDAIGFYGDGTDLLTNPNWTLDATAFNAAVGKLTGLTGQIELRSDGSGGGSDSTTYPGSAIDLATVVTFTDATEVPFATGFVGVPGGLVETDALPISSYTPPSPSILPTVLSDGVQPVSGAIPQTQFTVLAVNPTGSGEVQSITIAGTDVLGGLARSGTNYDTPALLAAALKNQINTYCTANNLDFSATVSNNIVVIRATDPSGYAALSGATVVVTVDDDVCVGNGAVVFSRASVTDPTWTGISVDGADQLGGTVNWNTDMTTSVQDVATQFNSNSTAYTAVASGSTLFISKLATSSNDTALQISVSGTDLNWAGANPGGGNTGVSGGTFPGTIDVGALDVPMQWLSSPGTIQTRTALSVIIGGGLPPYSTQWEQVSGPSEIDVTWGYGTTRDGYRGNVIAESALSPTTVLKFSPRVQQANANRLAYAAQWRCKVTDSLNRIGYSPTINVHYP